MAFCRKLCGLVGQGVLKNSVIGRSNEAFQMLNSVRYMSATLFVGGLNWGTDNQTLKEAFSSYGNVTEARIVISRGTGRSRGFGFVSFESDQSASDAMAGMNGQELQGRSIYVSYANERPAGPRDGGGGGGRWQFWIGGGFAGGRTTFKGLRGFLYETYECSWQLFFLCLLWNATKFGLPV
ncbi:glycine-rich RNA-binding protein 4, mitochondrial-like [Curcuma longa]|uniref:glycine-rich RNA-binding protein 4, mitochondrial-like n=1 Tax=Curcuma longa TaxID=136217 RepID=UPI003D9F1B16